MSGPKQDSMQFMKGSHSAHLRKILLICGMLLLIHTPRSLIGEPTPAAVSAFNSYTRGVESRLAQQHQSPNTFLVSTASAPEDMKMRPREGELIIEKLTPSTGANLPGALLHHWRGTAFAPGAKAADFERLIRDFNSYPQHFSPQVLQAKVFTQNGDRMQAWMRVRQKHIITVVMDTTYDITFGQLDVQHGYSISESTRISEVDGAGTGAERTLSASEDHGFLWRLNTFWSYVERDGGLYLQIEAISLTRSIPRSVGWAVEPYVESIPRESLEFTLRSACNALRK